MFMLFLYKLQNPSGLKISIELTSFFVSSMSITALFCMNSTGEYTYTLKRMPRIKQKATTFPTDTSIIP